MEIDKLNSTEKQKLIVLLKGRFKFDFIAKSDIVKSVKQLNYFIKNASSIPPTQRSEAERFQRDFSRSVEQRIIRQIENGGLVSDDELTIINELIPQLDKITIKPKLSDQVLAADEPLTQVLAYYEDILSRHENGESFDWEQPWLSRIVFGHPVNLDGRKYSGQNIEHLGIAQQLKGYSVPVWLTRKNLEELGVGNIDELPNAAAVVFAKPLYKHRTDDKAKLITKSDYEQLSDDERQEYRQIITRSHYPVWHPDDVSELIDADARRKMFNKSHYFELAERIANDKAFAKRFYSDRADIAIKALDDAATKLGIQITSHQDSCFYRPSTDVIAMVPREKFKSDTAYAGTYAHELVHASGHSKRLNRVGITNTEVPRNKHIYGFEELIAETGANNFLLRFNLPATLDRESAAYIVSWLKALNGPKQKKYGLFESAVKQGDEAARFIESSTSIRPLPYVDIDEDKSTLELESETLLVLSKLHEWKRQFNDGNVDGAQVIKREVQNNLNDIIERLKEIGPAHSEVRTNLERIMDHEFAEIAKYEKEHAIPAAQSVASVRVRRPRA